VTIPMSTELDWDCKSLLNRGSAIECGYRAVDLSWESELAPRSCAREFWLPHTETFFDLAGVAHNSELGRDLVVQHVSP
jgi:hypothetical protein